MVTSLVLSMMLSFAPSARAESWVVLVQAKDAVSPTLVDAVQKTAKKSVMRLNRRNKWINPPEVSLDELVMAAGCADWNNSCAGTVAGMVGATRALVVELSSIGDGVQTTLTVVNNRGRKIRSAETTLLPERLEDDIPFFVQSMLAKKPGTRLAFDTKPKGANVYVDGKKKGVTPLNLENVISPGKHVVTFKMKGKPDIEKKVMVAVGTQTKVVHTFKPKKVEKPKVATTGGTDETTTGTTGTGTTTGAPDENPDTETQTGTTTGTETEERVIGVTTPNDESGVPILTFSGIGVAALGSVIMLAGGLTYAGFYALRASECIDASAAQCTLKTRDGETHEEYLTRSDGMAEMLTAGYFGVLAAEAVGGLILVGGGGLAAAGMVLEE